MRPGGRRLPGEDGAVADLREAIAEELDALRSA